MRRNQRASINHTAYCTEQLQRGNLKGLAKRHSCQLHRLYIFLFVNNGGGFSGNIHTCLFHQTKLSQILIKIIHSHSGSHLNKHRIAGIHSGLHKILTAMSYCLVTSYPPVLHHLVSRTVKIVINTHHPALQPGSSCDNFKSGARFIGIVDALITPHFIQGILQFASRKPLCIRI